MADYKIVQEALHRGYSMDEIADKLSSLDGYDPAAIRERGYGSTEILSKLGYEPPKQTERGDTNQGLQRSWAQLPELAYGAGAMLAHTAESVFGEGGISTSAKDYFIEKFTEKQQANQQYAPKYQFTDALDAVDKGDYGPMADWLQDSVGYFGGQLALMVATGGVGAAVGKVALNSSIEKILAGTVARNADKLVAEHVAAKGLTGEAATFASKQMMPEAVKTAAGRTAQNFGAGIALTAQNLGMEAGDIYGSMRDEAAKTGNEITGADLFRGLGAAGAAAATDTLIDLLGLGAIAGRIKIGTKPIQKMTGVGGRLARGATGIAVGAPVEGWQEWVQTRLEQYGAGQPPDTEEAAKERINAMAQGAMGGTIIGGGAGMISKAQTPAPPKPEIPTPEWVAPQQPAIPDTGIKYPLATHENISREVMAQQTLDAAIAVAQRMAGTSTPEFTVGNEALHAGDTFDATGMNQRQQQINKQDLAEFARSEKFDQVGSAAPEISPAGIAGVNLAENGKGVGQEIRGQEIAGPRQTEKEKIGAQNGPVNEPAPPRVAAGSQNVSGNIQPGGNATGVSGLSGGVASVVETERHGSSVMPESGAGKNQPVPASGNEAVNRKIVLGKNEIYTFGIPEDDVRSAISGINAIAASKVKTKGRSKSAIDFDRKNSEISVKFSQPDKVDGKVKVSFSKGNKPISPTMLHVNQLNETLLGIEPKTKPKQQTKSENVSLYSAILSADGLNMSDLHSGTDDRKIGKNGKKPPHPLFNNNTKNTIASLIEEGELDDFIPHEMRASRYVENGVALDPKAAMNWIEDQLKNGNAKNIFSVADEDVQTRHEKARLDELRTEAEGAGVNWRKYKTEDALVEAIDAKILETREEAKTSLTDGEWEVYNSAVEGAQIHLSSHEMDLITEQRDGETQVQWHERTINEFRKAVEDALNNQQRIQAEDAQAGAGKQKESDGAYSSNLAANGDQAGNAAENFALKPTTEEPVAQRKTREAKAQKAEDKAAADRASNVPLTLVSPPRAQSSSANNQVGMFTPGGEVSALAERNNRAKESAASYKVSNIISAENVGMTVWLQPDDLEAATGVKFDVRQNARKLLTQLNNNVRAWESIKACLG